MEPSDIIYREIGRSIIEVLKEHATTQPANFQSAYADVVDAMTRGNKEALRIIDQHKNYPYVNN